MAARAGAVISDLELMMTAYLPNVAPSWSGRHKLLQSVIECATGYRSEYRIRWINAVGEEFLGKYPPDVPKGYEELYLKVIRAVHTELEEGRGPLYMDYRTLPREFLEDVAPFILKMMEKLDRDEGEYLLEVGPNPMWSFGGVKIDEQCASNLPGLYACGDASNGIKDGFGASVACGVTTCLVLGKRAGEHGAKRAQSIAQPQAKEAEAHEELSRIEELLSRDGDCSALQMKHEIGALMRKHMHLKNESGMTECLAAIRGLRDGKARQIALTSKSRGYNYELVEALETRHMLDAAEMLISASLIRRESRRHLFIREDYPERDDANWLRHIHIRRDGEDLDLTTVPVEFPYIRPDATGLRVDRSAS
jgi:succinate dehydrogenase / fumarate reductase flavoprotein subunit